MTICCFSTYLLIVKLRLTNNKNICNDWAWIIIAKESKDLLNWDELRPELRLIHLALNFYWFSICILQFLEIFICCEFSVDDRTRRPTSRAFEHCERAREVSKDQFRVQEATRHIHKRIVTNRTAPSFGTFSSHFALDRSTEEWVGTNCRKRFGESFTSFQC